mmetsp:Transcript_22602/g.59024  ORF Transcript_22602/g.59024 Transcript_22602/m.59024 type:complete len:202 (+) Transcript_22602:349-954(+)
MGRMGPPRQTGSWGPPCTRCAASGGPADAVSGRPLQRHGSHAAVFCPQQLLAPAAAPGGGRAGGARRGCPSNAAPPDASSTRGTACPIPPAGARPTHVPNVQVSAAGRRGGPRCLPQHHRQAARRRVPLLRDDPHGLCPLLARPRSARRHGAGAQHGGRRRHVPSGVVSDHVALRCVGAGPRSWQAPCAFHTATQEAVHRE